MKIICSGLDLSDALSKVSKALPVKRTMPILDGIKLSAQGSTLSLCATDNYFTIQKTINAEVIIEGEVVVPGKLFGDFIRKLSGEQVELELCVGNSLSVKYLDSETKFNCFNTDEFPPIMDSEYDIQFSIKQSDLKNIINRTIFCASTSDSRPVLKGCLFELEGSILTAVALNGYQLAMVKKNLEREYPKYSSVIPCKSLAEIAKLLDEDEKFVTVGLSSKKCVVDALHTKITTSLIEGDFVQYKAYLQDAFHSTMVVNKKLFEETLERASILSRAEKNQVKLDINENLMVVTSDSPMGTINEKMTVSLSGIDISIALNITYMLDALRAVDDEFIKICFKKPSEPFFVKQIEGNDYLYLIVPINIYR